MNKPKQSSGQIDAIVAGYIGVDLTPSFPKRSTNPTLGEFLRPGKLVEANRLTISLGGIVANTGLAMTVFGKRVCLNAMVGEDTLGDIIVTLLRQKQAVLRIRRTGTAHTGYGIVLAPPGTEPIVSSSNLPVPIL